MKPILFNTPMVRAILEDRKGATRRIIPWDKVNAVLNSPARKNNPDVLDEVFVRNLCDCRYSVGDILYVRETWAITSRIRDIADDGPVYMADLSEMELRYLRDKGFKWRPSIHMPKDLARIFLRVTDIQAERLQDITNEGILLEGVLPRALKAHGCECAWAEDGCRDKPCANRDAYERLTYSYPFSELWDSTLRPAEREEYGWKADPWAWAIRFERVEKPEVK